MTRAELAAAIATVSTEEFSRSGGPGGQNVNKVNTQVTLRVPLDRLGLDDAELERVREKLSTRCNAAGELVIQVSDTRSQRTNRDLAADRAVNLITEAIRRPRRRRPTRPSAAARERRLTEKKQRGRTKQERRRPDE